MDPAKLVDSREFTSTGVSTLVASWIKKDSYKIKVFILLHMFTYYLLQSNLCTTTTNPRSQKIVVVVDK
jgi:hypothetical protein